MQILQQPVEVFPFPTSLDTVFEQPSSPKKSKTIN
jgi:hypothetical protein